MTTLFENIDRPYLGPANNRENAYDYFTRSGRKDIGIVRDKLEEWFGDIPDTDKKEIKRRFKKSFDSVFYELFLFQLFRHLGFTVTFHPTITDTDKKPDFLITKGSLEIYVEAKISKDKSHAEEADERRLNQFYDSLNKIKSESFLLNIDTLNFKTDKQPQTKKLIKHIEQELTLIDPDYLFDSLQGGGFESLPSIKYSDEEIDIIVKPMPVIQSARGKIDRAIGMFPFESFVGGAEESLQDSINFKAKRYGALDKPYLICINALSIKTSSGVDIENAIWGSLAYSWSTNPNNRDGKLIRQPDGVFFNKKGKRIPIVSGILVTRVFSTNIPNANYWLFKHPFTETPLDFDLLGLKYNYVENNEIKKCTGDDLDKILNIKKDWLAE